MIWPDCVEIIGESVNDPRCKESFLKCKECKHKLEHADKPLFLAGGQWKATETNVLPEESRGFYINQLYSSTVTPGELVTAYHRGLGDEAANTEFHCSKLGLPFIGVGAQVTDEMIEACLKGHTINDTRPQIGGDRLITMGVDQGKTGYISVVDWRFDRAPGDDTLLEAADDTEVGGRRDGGPRRRPRRGPLHDRPPDHRRRHGVAVAHTEVFGAIDEVARAKGELVEALTADGTAVLNQGDERVAAMAGRTAATVLTYGVDRGDVRAEGVVLDDELRPRFALVAPWGEAERRPGRAGPAPRRQRRRRAPRPHWCAGRTLDDVIAGLAAASLSPWRMDLRVRPVRPPGAQRRLQRQPHVDGRGAGVAGRAPAERRTAVLGVMAELGAQRRGRAPRIDRARPRPSASGSWRWTPTPYGPGRGRRTGRTALDLLGPLGPRRCRPRQGQPGRRPRAPRRAPPRRLTGRGGWARRPVELDW